MSANEIQSAQSLDLVPGLVAEVVIHMEMTARPQIASPDRHDLVITALRPDLDGYRRRFRQVGAPWLWSFRLRLADGELAAIIGDPEVEIFDLLRDGQFIGLLELDFRRPGMCEIAYFGIMPDAIGTGAGRFLMQHAIARAWSREPRIARLTVHTCTHDHPAALAFYLRSGFQPVRRSVEIYPDPRLGGPLARSDAPQIPLIE